MTSIGLWCCLCAGVVAQVPTGTGWIVLDVPSDVHVYFNGQPTRTTGAHRRYYRQGLQQGKAYSLQMRIVGDYGGKPWIRDETVPLRAGETVHRTYRYAKSADSHVARRVPSPALADGESSRFGVEQQNRHTKEGIASDEQRQYAAQVPPLPPIDKPAEESAFFVVPLSELELTEGALDQEYLQKLAQWSPVTYSRYPWVMTEGDGEGYVDLSDPHRPVLALRSPKGHDAAGQLFLPPVNSDQGRVVSYRVVATDSWGRYREEFYQIKGRSYRGRLRDCSAGSAWFRHQLRDAENRLVSAPSPQPALSLPARRESDLMKWFDIFTGGRAIAENLSLEPIETTLHQQPPLVLLSTIPGVLTPAINWDGMLPQAPPSLDSLAHLIPSDQHAVFFPSVSCAYKLAQHSAIRETVLIGLFVPRGQRWRIRERYERQLGISLEELVDLLGPNQAGRIALTGSDPHVAMGTDAAILIESPDPAALANKLANRIADNTRDRDGIQSEIWRGPELIAKGVFTADRRTRAFVGALQQAVILTNSTYQLQRLVDVQSGGTKPLASELEYHFFRDRYRIDDPHETALVVISDATIRRWSNPRWRIGQARRLRAAAVLAEWQAACLDPRRPVLRELPSSGANESESPAGVIMGAEQAISLQYGTLEFMTPVAELPLDRVTNDEKLAYERWRDIYSGGWVRFDPIAICFGITDQRLAMDLTVMPLRNETRYETLRSLAQGASLDSEAGDPHDSLAELGVAINKDSPYFTFAQMILAAQLGGPDRSGKTDPLAWFGGTVTIYADSEPAWKDVVQHIRSATSPREQMMRIFGQLPIGIQLEVADPVGLTKFLLAVRSLAEAVVPGMLKWELRQHRGEPYATVCIGRMLGYERQGDPGASTQTDDGPAVYYAPTSDSLVIAFRESVMQHALERRVVRSATSGNRQAATRDWLRGNVALHADTQLFRLLSEVVDEEYRSLMLKRAWDSLPILNEWKQRYPDEDPVVVHERLWGVRLVCPGGGGYQWNERWQTMESTLYGHPDSPKNGPGIPSVFTQLTGADAALTFEPNGLRAQVTLQLEKADRDSDR